MTILEQRIVESGEASIGNASVVEMQKVIPIHPSAICFPSPLPQSKFLISIYSVQFKLIFGLFVFHYRQ